ncbi:RusA family crossover junction endodeoxyribonuclease [Streptomyces sp. C10-9-1]|uniref:RusA family crossover junction endodeoxyribonuclease n=1 Tax=Streptomyces sp. C10-9-1 TaxID=1859285 RepID=UPI003F49B831
MTKPILTLTVYGKPAPQGSKSHKGGGRMVESSAYVKPWRERVVAVALDSLQHRDWTRLDAPLLVCMDFFFDRPKSHFGTGRNAGLLKASAPARPTGPPDLSKLVRSTEDALQTAGAYRDDALIVSIATAKRYVDDGPGSLDRPGALITISRLPATLQEVATP